SLFFQAEDGIRYWSVTGVQTCALPISAALHYPELFRVLPGMFGRIDAVTLAIVGLWVAGAASAQVAALSDGVTPAPGACLALARSEERRVGKEGGDRWGRCH